MEKELYKKRSLSTCTKTSFNLLCNNFATIFKNVAVQAMPEKKEDKLGEEKHEKKKDERGHPCCELQPSRGNKWNAKTVCLLPQIQWRNLKKIFSETKTLIKKYYNKFFAWGPTY